MFANQYERAVIVWQFIVMTDCSNPLVLHLLPDGNLTARGCLLLLLVHSVILLG